MERFDNANIFPYISCFIYEPKQRVRLHWEHENQGSEGGGLGLGRTVYGALL
jgi:hypothetical protein